jgi:hypothetical protein
MLRSGWRDALLNPGQARNGRIEAACLADELARHRLQSRLDARISRHAGLRPVFLSLANKVSGIKPIFFHVTRMTRICAQRIDFDQTQIVAFNYGPPRPLRDFT